MLLWGADPVTQWWDTQPQPPYYNAVHAVLTAGAAAAMILTARRTGVLPGLQLNPTTARRLVTGALIGVLLATTPKLLSLILLGSVEPGASRPGMAAALPAIVLTGPFLEELVFRGVLLGWLAERLPFPAAAGASSVAFAAIHPAGPLWAFVAGMAMCYLVRSSASLYPALHSMLPTT